VLSKYHLVCKYCYTFPRRHFKLYVKTGGEEGKGEKRKGKGREKERISINSRLKSDSKYCNPTTWFANTATFPILYKKYKNREKGEERGK
jgi:hypothetical protein